MITPDGFAVSPPIRAEDRACWSADAMAEARVICERWGLGLVAVIGADAIPPGGLAEDALHRIGCLIGVDRALTVALGPEQGRAWLRQPNTGLAFAGRSPAALMQHDGLPGLLAVRGILEAWKVGAFAPPAEDAPPMRFRIAPA